MTTVLPGQEIADLIAPLFPGAIIEYDSQAVIVKAEYLLKIMEYLKTNPELAFTYLTDITSVDYLDYFELVYRLTSIEHNKSIVLKIRCCGRENLEVPSATSLWKGAEFMEREIFDLMGISFAGHSNLRRIFLWKDFKGYPLRKDYV